MEDEKSIDKEKALSLFLFLSEICRLRAKVIKNIDAQIWKLPLSGTPRFENYVSISYRDTFENEEKSDDPLVKVVKPEFEKCPELPDNLLDWVSPGWDNFQETPRVKDHIEFFDPETEDYDFKFFKDDEKRVVAYKEWINSWEVWSKRQNEIKAVRDLFTDLHKRHVELQRNSETYELVAANGFIKLKDDPEVNHPIIFRRLRIIFDPDSNTIAIVDKEDTDSELYTTLLRDLSSLNLDYIREAESEIKEKELHPLDRNEAADFLKRLINTLSPKNDFIDLNEEIRFSPDSEILLYMNPTILIRKRLDGSAKAISRIIEDIKEDGDIPPYLREIVSGSIDDEVQIDDVFQEETIEQKLAEVGGEDFEILLCKEANREQLEIARRIEKHNAVLVQGPPGTGKTHSIANLIGHFLAQGKSVLVTSQTSKALSVLKDKLHPDIRDLCVSLLDDDKKDMESSINGISDYTGRHTARELEIEVNNLEKEREEIIDDLADSRERLFNSLNREYKSFVFSGDHISPVEAAKFVNENAFELATIIPGEITIGAPFPLSHEEVMELYSSNSLTDSAEEKEIIGALPDPASLLSPKRHAEILEKVRKEKENIARISESNEWTVIFDEKTGDLEIPQLGYKVNLAGWSKELLKDFSAFLASQKPLEEWMIHAIMDSNMGGEYLARWEELFEQIERTNELSEILIKQGFGKEVSGFPVEGVDNPADQIAKIRNLYKTKGKVGKIARMTNKELDVVLDSVRINGNVISSAEDCEFLLNTLSLLTQREICNGYWHDLIEVYGAPCFSSLDTNNPEVNATSWIPQIKEIHSWETLVHKELENYLRLIGADPTRMMGIGAHSTYETKVRRIQEQMQTSIPDLIRLIESAIVLYELSNEKEEALSYLSSAENSSSDICQSLARALADEDVDEYDAAYEALSGLYGKSVIVNKRAALLAQVYSVAKLWASAIAQRHGIHGKSAPPSNLKEAWKWKQYSMMLDELNAISISELQDKCTRLSQQYRKKTAELAEKKAWLALLRRTERNTSMRQALQGWTQTVKKIGKGTGKRAAQYRAEARKKMSECQEAVPAWIMPISRAYENLDPTKNKFDIVIVDEASQSDITALGITYMARKIIIVGDDKQVSPMSVGIDVESMMNLSRMYLSDSIPNAHLYEASTSLYDIAMTTFHPLMLREHFRCVPEIIGYSNWLSYDNRIKPLRDPSQCETKPFVIDYRVKNGQRDAEQKINIAEAEEILNLIDACLEQPEYEDKSFGIISMLGREQSELIQKMIYERLEPAIIEKHQILCGIAPDFQGDERDIIFLSLVDSRTPDSEGPLRKLTFGTQDAYRKRYNVATSRARDQLWIVHSLDPSFDLKEGDIRRGLLEYARDPKSSLAMISQIENKSDSPFEASVCMALTSRGYRIAQQWEVGAYRIDMVAIDSEKRIAIECDGDKWHSGEQKIIEDMERQAILERIGWRFIRIRGSEYYRDPEAAINRIVKELNDYGIGPTYNDYDPIEEAQAETDLLEKVKVAAYKKKLANEEEKLGAQQETA